MATDYERRVRAVRWTDYEGSCGSDPSRVPEQLLRLRADHSATARAAARRLGDLLSHQSDTASVAVPAMPFLLDVLATAPDDLAVELLELLYYFACTARWHRRRRPMHAEPDWVTHLRAQLVAASPAIGERTASGHEDVAGFAASILEELDDGPPTGE